MKLSHKCEDKTLIKYILPTSYSLLFFWIEAGEYKNKI